MQQGVVGSRTTMVQDGFLVKVEEKHAEKIDIHRPKILDLGVRNRDPCHAG